MMMTRNLRAGWAAVAVMILSSLAGVVRGQVYEGVTLVEPRLVADTTAVRPGETFRVGLVLRMAPKWHTYWQYSGDAGLPTRIEWTLPEGFAAGPIEWPLPEGILEAGDIQVYAYKDEVMLITTLRAPAELAAGGGPVTLRAKASWLVCEAICVPGSAELELVLPVAGEAEAANAELFARWEARLPTVGNPPFAVQWERDGPDLVARMVPGEGVTAVEFFPLPGENQEVGHPVTVREGEEFVVRLAVEGELNGVLAVADAEGRRGWMVNSADGSAEAAGGGSTVAKADGPSLWVALWWGFVGGIILNLMPCVLPVISLKVFGFVRQAGESPRRIFLHGVAFAGGIFAWFLGLGILIAVLKAGGSEVTWAFQFQNPIFNIVVAAIVFVFALNLMGVFEVTLPGRATGAMSDLGGQEGFGGSFFQGVFATLLATPCTGPFLGTALGFAFSQPPAVILAMFGSVALGMALPYLVLSARPGWIRFLPKPGAWMERLKQFMAFPLFATLLWLLFVVGQQRGTGAVIAVGAFLLCLAVACWLYGAFCGPLSSVRGRTVAMILAAVVAVAGGWYFLPGAVAGEARTADAGGGEAKEGGVPWVPFSPAKVAELRAEGRPVFVDFTADWCITCKFNERTAIDRPAVIALMAERGVVPVKADWTNANPEITAALAEFGRVGVPFVVLYPADGGDPIVLPEILTESIVLDALRRL